MSNFILFDDKRWQQLLPLTFTRPTAELRIGIDTIREKWIAALQSNVSYLTETYLSEKFPAKYSEDNIYIFGGVIPNAKICKTISELKTGDVLMQQGGIIAIRSAEKYFTGMSLAEHAKSFKVVNYDENTICISRSWHLFQNNDAVLRMDFDRITKNRVSQTISSTNTIIGNSVFIEEGAIVEGCIINSTTGPVYIGKNAEIMEGAMLRGPIAIGDFSTIKMGAKIYGATTIGPHCKVGGEINNSVITGYSNKAHDGFLGNSVIGEWCNLGADTNNSNLKNNYAEVKLWDYVAQQFIATGLQFCGLIMGDHSKCGINTMFNTGTVVGVNTNIFGDGFPRNFIPSYSWGGAKGFTTYKLTDALAVAKEVMHRRNTEINNTDIKILTHIYELSEKYRKGQLIFIHK